MDEQKQPTGLFVAVILGVLAGYVAGLGPACWLSSRFGGANVVTLIYRPITFAVEAIGSERLVEAIQSYSELGASESHLWTLSPDVPGHAEWGPLVFLNIDLSGGSSMLYPLAPEALAVSEEPAGPPAASGTGN